MKAGGSDRALARPGNDKRSNPAVAGSDRSLRGTSRACPSPRDRLVRADAPFDLSANKGKVAPRPFLAGSTVTEEIKMYWSPNAAGETAKLYIVAAAADERESLGRQLSAADLDVSWFATGEQFLRAVRADAPGAVVSDLDLADMSGFSLLNAMRRSGRVLPLILLTAADDAACAVQALRLGVFDLFRKPADTQELRGRVGDALRIDVDRFTRRRLLVRAHAAVSALSARERQVMELVVAGSANKVIASDLGISEKTVEAHRGKVMRKMQVDSLAELVRVNVILEEVARREMGL
jgi:FixJ family two-component response regulator